MNKNKITAILFSHFFPPIFFRTKGAAKPTGDEKVDQVP